MAYQHHKAYSWGYYFKCAYDDNLSYYQSYRGDNCVQWFLNEMTEVDKFVLSKSKNIVPMVEKLCTIGTTTYHICEQPFLDSDITRDHDHFTGLFRGFCHQTCNANFWKLFLVPIMHNLYGYDSHFVIIELEKQNSVTVLSVNREKYISFTSCDVETKINFRYIDFFRIMSSSLDELLPKLAPEGFKILKKEFNTLNDEFKLLTKKDVCPYDCIDSTSKLSENNLPSIGYFYNKLNDEHISDGKYAHA